MMVAEALDKTLFWDVNPETLDWEKNRQFIIERSLQRGLSAEVDTIFSIYKIGQIKSAVLKRRTFDKKTANYFSIKLDIPLLSINVAPEHY